MGSGPEKSPAWSRETTASFIFNQGEGRRGKGIAIHRRLIKSWQCDQSSDLFGQNATKRVHDWNFLLGFYRLGASKQLPARRLRRARSFAGLLEGTLLSVSSAAINPDFSRGRLGGLGGDLADAFHLGAALGGAGCAAIFGWGINSFSRWDDGFAARCRARGGAGQAAGERAFASLAAARRHSAAFGQAEANTILTRRALILTSAPSFKSFKRIVPQVALASAVCGGARRRSAHTSA